MAARIVPADPSSACCVVAPSFYKDIYADDVNHARDYEEFKTARDVELQKVLFDVFTVCAGIHVPWERNGQRGWN